MWLSGQGAGFACGCSGFKSHSDHCLDLSWVISELYQPRFVNSLLVCLLSVGFFNRAVCVSNSEKLAYQLPQNPSINKVTCCCLFDCIFLISQLVCCVLLSIQILRVDVTAVSHNMESPEVDTAMIVCFAPPPVNQLLVVTSSCRLLKLDSNNGMLLSEVR